MWFVMNNFSKKMFKNFTSLISTIQLIWSKSSWSSLFLPSRLCETSVYLVSSVSFEFVAAQYRRICFLWTVLTWSPSWTTDCGGVFVVNGVVVVVVVLFVVVFEVGGAGVAVVPTFNVLKKVVTYFPNLFWIKHSNVLLTLRYSELSFFCQDVPK